MRQTLISGVYKTANQVFTIIVVNGLDGMVDCLSLSKRLFDAILGVVFNLELPFNDPFAFDLFINSRLADTIANAFL